MWEERINFYTSISIKRCKLKLFNRINITNFVSLFSSGLFSFISIFSLFSFGLFSFIQSFVATIRIRSLHQSCQFIIVTMNYCKLQYDLINFCIINFIMISISEIYIYIDNNLCMFLHKF